MRELSLEISYMRAQINLTDFNDDPTSRSINTDLLIPLKKGISKKVNMFVTPLQFEREESLLQLGQEDLSTKTYSIEKIREYDQYTSPLVLSDVIRMDSRTSLHI